MRSEGELLSQRLAVAVEMAAIEPGMTVLDIGCGRGEVVRHCAELGADTFGVDYSLVAVNLTRDLLARVDGLAGRAGVGRANARLLPFADGQFDRILLLDVVEHLYPWELDEALLEMRRVLKQGGELVIHTAPNGWYNRYAYPLVRLVRRMMGQGAEYPRNARQFGVAVNEDVHVNEQDLLSLRWALRRAGLRGGVWLDTPPQERDDSVVVRGLRKVAFGWPPFRWFFRRDVFAVGRKV